MLSGHPTGSASLREGHDLWAITCYFNPAAYRRRLANYRVFRRCLTVPLVTVELAYGPSFELHKDDAEILVQLRGRDVMWQKERLLNVALRALPRSCRKVAWLDCDIVFAAGDWAERTSALLERFVLVQPFSHLHRMPRDWGPGREWPAKTQLRYSVPFLMESGMPLADCLGPSAEDIACSPGYVWAANRELLDAHGLYDACIVGSADAAMIRAAYGCFDFAMRRQHMNLVRREHYLAWARSFHDAVCAKVAYVPGNLFHVWHGETEHRGYQLRHRRLEGFEFDPAADIAMDHNGAWRWNSGKRDMHNWLREYFASRREDG
jgi:hypothetical protein